MKYVDYGKITWRCRVQRSHGICNNLNDDSDETCGACGEDRPVTKLPEPQLVMEVRALLNAITALDDRAAIIRGVLKAYDESGHESGHEGGIR